MILLRRCTSPVALLLTFCAAAFTSPNDCWAESMAHYNDASRERSFNSYMSSGAHNYYPDQHRQTFVPATPPSRYTAPETPSQGWNQYWRNYNPPAYQYTPPVYVDRRTPQQVLLDAAKAGNAIAMWNLAHNYLLGQQGFSADTPSGIFWLKAAFEHGYTEAGYSLFALFDPDMFAGEGDVKKDPIQSLYWLQKAAKAGNAAAMVMLGGRTLQGAGVEADPVEGIRLLKAGLKAGDKGALIKLESAYEWGFGVEKDLSEAVHWQREMAKIQLLPDSKVELMRLLVETDDPVNRTHTAEILALVASDPNDAEMKMLYARLADNGVLGAPDPAKCVALCQEILGTTGLWRGDKYVINQAQYLLADHLYEGNGVKKDDVAAYHLYLEAAQVDSGRHPQSARNKFYLASLLSGRLATKNSDGTTERIDDYAKALPLLRAAQGSDDLPDPLRAQAALLAARLLGQHPEAAGTNTSLTVDYELELARKFDPDTTLGIAFGLRSGWFGAPDKAKSREVMKFAADAGDSKAAFWLTRWACEDSNGKDPNWQSDLEALLKNKNWDSFVWVSEQFSSGKFLPKDLPRAESILRTAATEGDNPDAQNALGVALWRGALGEKKVGEGLGWMEKSLQNGLWLAGRNLAKIYHLGLDVEKDETRARAYLEKSGELGGSESASVVAAAYEKGDIIAADPEAAARWRATAQN